MTPEEVAALEAAKKKLLESGEFVPKSDVDERQQDLLKHKKARKEAEDRINELERKAAEDEKRKLTETQQFKELYEKEAEKTKEFETRDKKRSSSLANYLKTQALKDAALKLGLKTESIDDLKFVGLKDVQVEMTQAEDGETDIKVTNADKVAERIKQIRPHWFGSGKRPNLNTEDPGVVDGNSVTMKQVEAAEEKARKSGDPEDADAYRKILIRYRDQSRNRK